MSHFEKELSLGHTFKYVKLLQFKTAVDSKGISGVNINENAVTAVINMNAKNIVFLTRNWSTIAPTIGLVIKLKIGKIQYIVPTTIVEYPSCFAIVGKNDKIGATPENKNINYILVSFCKTLIW